MNNFTFTVDRENKKVIIERIFDAPRELVYKTHIDPELIPQWWTDTKVEEMDVRPGGKWKFVSNNNGYESTTVGEYKELVPNEKIIETFGGGPVEMLNTTTFEDMDGGRTKLTKTIEFKSVEDLETMSKYGLEPGAKFGYDKLEQLLEKIK
jgi:uncharacterized protein YndB with AHSA1/START domain